MIKYNGMKTVGVTDYTKKTTPTHFKWKKHISSTPIKCENIYLMCTK